MTVERVDSPLAGRRPGPLGPVGGVSALGGQASGTGVVAPLADRSAAPFWLELKGVERWFDTLDTSERLALLTALFGRCSEPQLRQFSAAIDKSLQTAQYASTPAAAPGPPPFASNLSRFGVGQPAAAASSSDYASLRYHTPIQKQPSGSGNSAGAPSAPGTVPGGTAGPVPGSSSGPSVGTVNTGASGSGYMSPLSQPLSAPLSNSQNAFTPSSDLYAQAFLPLPRSKSYTPWGPEIRPKSATADAWPDLGSGRASPQPAQSSPNLAALSLDQTSASTSPIGHPVKPWRTFTPVGLGQAPEQFDPSRTTRPASTQSVQSAGHASAHGSSHGAASAHGSSVLANGISSMSHAPPVPPLNMELNRRSSHSHPQQPQSAGAATSSSVGPQTTTLTGTQLTSHVGTPFAPQFAARTGPQATSPTGPHKIGGTQHSETSPTSLPSSESGFISVASSSGADFAGSPTPPLYTLVSKQSPKRGVNVIDVELLSDIGAWLRSLRLHKYTGNLAGMRWQEVIQLEDADLESRGVNALGARRKLLKMFEEIRQAQEAGLLPEDDEA